jgi:hypothetical protein
MQKTPSNKTIAMGCGSIVLTFVIGMPIFFFSLWVKAHFGFIAGAVVFAILVAPVFTRIRKWNETIQAKFLEESGKSKEC